MINTTLTVFALAVAPTIEFTSDSTYKQDKALDLSVSERVVQTIDDDTGEVVSETRDYTLNVKENYVLGHTVYDDPSTAYVDGVKVDGTFLATDWRVKDFDLGKNHVITVKTVYSDDVAGWFAKAKAGDFSAIMSNPITLVQLGYYVLAGLSIVLGGFGLFKYRKLKVKSSEEIAKVVADKADALKEQADNAVREAETQALSLVTDVVTPLVNTLRKQNDMLIEATVLARSGDEQSTLALLELLKNAGTEGVNDLADNVKKRIEESRKAAEAAKAEAVKTMKEAVAEISAPADAAPKGGYDGTSI